MAYDALQEAAASRAVKEYLKILELAAEEGEMRVDDVLRELLERKGEGAVTVDAIREMLRTPETITPVTMVEVAAVDLTIFDQLCPGMAVRQ
jgi:hypothetical protein